MGRSIKSSCSIYENCSSIEHLSACTTKNWVASYDDIAFDVDEFIVTNYVS
jgi:hypothetical protein